MKPPAVKNISSQTIAFILMWAIVFFSCQHKQKDVQSIFVTRKEPVPNAEIRDFTAHYTLKGNLALLLKSPLMKDYSQYDFAYQIFPEGIEITIYNRNDQGGKTIITADTAAMYKATQLLELLGNVKIRNTQNEELETTHLFWDRTHEHIFTDDPVRFKRNEEYIHGKGFDSNMSFTDARVNNVTGVFHVR